MKHVMTGTIYAPQQEIEAVFAPKSIEVQTLVENEEGATYIEIVCEDVNGKKAAWMELQELINTYCGIIQYHPCTHDEGSPNKCEIVETYMR